MSLVYTLKLLCDLMFYFTFAGLLCSLATGNGLLTAVPYFLGLAFFAGILAERPRLKYLPLVLLIPALYFTNGSLWNYFFMLPACAYCVYYVHTLPFEVTRMEYADIFSLYMKISIPAVIFLYAAAKIHLEAVAIPYGTMFVFFSIILMRMLRHDKDVLEKTSFKILNTVSVGAMLIIGWVLSSKTVIGLFISALKAVYFEIIAPVVILLLTGLIYLLRPLLSLFEVNRLEEGSFEDISTASIWDVFEEEIAAEAGPGLVIIRTAMFIGFLLLLLFLAYKLFKKITQTYSERPSAGPVTRVPLTEKEERSRIFQRENPVRRVYKRFMRLCADRGIPFYTETTTLDLQKASANLFGEREKAGALRDIYIKCRYGEEKPTKEEIKECKSIYTALKKKDIL